MISLRRFLSVIWGEHHPHHKEDTWEEYGCEGRPIHFLFLWKIHLILLRYPVFVNGCNFWGDNYSLKPWKPLLWMLWWIISKAAVQHTCRSNHLTNWGSLQNSFHTSWDKQTLQHVHRLPQRLLTCANTSKGRRLGRDAHQKPGQPLLDGSRHGHGGGNASTKCSHSPHQTHWLHPKMIPVTWLSGHIKTSVSPITLAYFKLVHVMRLVYLPSSNQAACANASAFFALPYSNSTSLCWVDLFSLFLMARSLCFDFSVVLSSCHHASICL